MRLRLPKLNWFDCLLVAIGLIVLAGMMSVWYFYRWPQVYKFSCQIDRTKPQEPCQFVLDGNNFVAPIQSYVMFPVATAQSLRRVQLTKTELAATPFVSFYQNKKLVGFYRVEDTNALMALIARSGFAILTADKLSMKFTCEAHFGGGISCKIIP